MVGALFEQLLEASSTIVHVELDRAGAVTAVNAAFAREVGQSPDEIVGRPVSDYLTVSQAEQLMDSRTEPEWWGPPPPEAAGSS